MNQQQQQQGMLNKTPIMSPLSPNQLQQQQLLSPLASSQQQQQHNQNLVLTSKLLRLTVIDQANEIDKQWTACLKTVDELIANCTETEAANKLHERLSVELRNKQVHADTCLGLMFGFFITPDLTKAIFVCCFFYVKPFFCNCFD